MPFEGLALDEAADGCQHRAVLVLARAFLRQALVDLNRCPRLGLPFLDVVHLGRRELRTRDRGGAPRPRTASLRQVNLEMYRDLEEISIPVSAK